MIKIVLFLIFPTILTLIIEYMSYKKLFVYDQFNTVRHSILNLIITLHGLHFSNASGPRIDWFAFERTKKIDMFKKHQNTRT